MSRTFSSSGNALLNTSAAVTGTPATLACWAWSDSADGISRRLIGVGVSTTDLLSLSRASNNKLFCQHYDGATGEANMTTNMPAGEWVFCGAVFASDSDRTVYENTTSVNDTTARSALSGMAHTTIGYLKWSTNIQWWNGRIADVAIWDAALSSDEMAALANRASPLSIRPGSLTRYWPLRNGTGSDFDLIAGEEMTELGTVGEEESPLTSISGSWPNNFSQPAAAATILRPRSPQVVHLLGR